MHKPRNPLRERIVRLRSPTCKARRTKGKDFPHCCLSFKEAVRERFGFPLHCWSYSQASPHPRFLLRWFCSVCLVFCSIECTTLAAALPPYLSPPPLFPCL